MYSLVIYPKVEEGNPRRKSVLNLSALTSKVD